MIYTIPDYYKEFQCIADKCEDTCCAGWQIVIDEKSLFKYKSMIKDGKMRLRLLSMIDWREKVFRQSKEKRCAFLNEDNLCDLYSNCGESSLCKTCKRYPRHIEEFEGVREITLSISCPEVARILLSKAEPVSFLSYEREGEEEYEEFDPFFFSILEDSRVEMINILQERTLPLRQRVVTILAMAHDMQGRINRQEMFACMDVIEKYCGEKASEYINGYVGKEGNAKVFHEFARTLFEKQYQLELLKEEWDMLLHEADILLYGNGAEYYKKLHTDFASWMENNSELTVQLEQLLVYFLFTYFPGAVYDGEVYAKVQMSVYLTWMIYELLMARWQKNGGTLTQEEIVDITYRFSREVEHSDENLKLVEKWMRKKIFLKSRKLCNLTKKDNGIMKKYVI